MSTPKETTLRLHMPQWQGGNLHNYYFGASLLAWLAPTATGPVETICGSYRCLAASVSFQ